MLAELIAVCLIGVSDGEVHHKRGHDNYYFKDFVCSEKNLPVAPDSCGKAKEYLERPRMPFDILLDEPPRFELFIPLPLQVEMKLREFYALCCEEA